MSAVQALAEGPAAQRYAGQEFSAFGGRMVLSFGELSVDGRTVRLTASQAALLGELMRHGKPESFETLRQATARFQRDSMRGGESNVVSTQICAVRKKLASVSEDFVIASQWGWGFVLRAREVQL